RLLLETSWEAVEDAGIDARSLAGSLTGVFVGQTGTNYWSRMDPAQRGNLYAVVGTDVRSSLPGRISYALDLRGPSVTVDTACASSLTALHLACQSIRSGESDVALAAGISMILGEEQTAAFVAAKMTAKDGDTKFGDARADGLVRSEGVGVVVLKPLDAAIADGDRIYAKILGSASTNDGKSSGLFVHPGMEGQELMLTRACLDAGIDPTDIDYVEAHGTGTRAGDPIEIGAIGRALGGSRTQDNPLLVGSVKTNIGHCEAAAGIAGLIKTALALRHRHIPPSLHFRQPTPAIPWDELPVRVADRGTPLGTPGRPAVAGVSSFGVTGTNVHVLLMDHDSGTPDASRPALPARDAQDEPVPEVLTVSARSEEALRQAAADLARHLTDGPGTGQALRDVAFSLRTRRTPHEQRLAVVADSRADAADKLRAFAAGERLRGVTSATARDTAPPRVAFVFPGQGSQWVGMGRRLLADSPAFREALEACDAAVRAETGWSVIGQLLGEGERFAEVDVLQPTLWAVEVALAAHWRSLGVEPDLLIGHSMGEVAAACVAGALSLEEAAAVICRRSALARRVSGGGAMAVVGLAAAELEEYLTGREELVALAASNSPRSTVLSGDAATIDAIVDELQRRDVFSRKVEVPFASHSPQVDPVLDELRSSLDGLQPLAGKIPLYSTALDRLIDGSECDAAYWAHNLRAPVRFSSAVGAVAGERETVFLEISPHPVLVGSVEETLADLGLPGEALASARRQDETATPLEALGRLHTLGHPVDWDAAYPDGGAYVPLPTYPWQRERYWFDDEPAPAPRPAPGHPLLAGATHATSGQGGFRWDLTVDFTAHGHLLEQRLRGTVLAPTPLYIDAVTAAARQSLGRDDLRLEHLVCEQAWLVENERTGRLALTFTPAGEGVWEVEIRAGDGTDGPAPDRRASVRLVAGCGPSPEQEAPGAVRARCATELDVAAFYGQVAAAGLVWGPSLRAVTGLWRGEGEALARLEAPQALRAGLAAHAFHPALLEAAGAPLFAAVPEQLAGRHPGEVPYFVSAEGVRLLGPARETLWSHARVRQTDGADGVLADLRILDDEGRTVAEMTGVRTRYPARGVPRQPATVVRQPETVVPLDIPGTGRVIDGDDRVVASVPGLRLRFVADVPAVLPPQSPAAVTPLPAPLPEPVQAPLPAPARTVTPAPVPAAVPAAAPEAAPAPDAAAFVRETVAGALGIRADRLRPDAPLKSVGLDSLMASQIKSALRDGLGVDVPLPLLLDATTTVAAIAEEARLRKAG
ncbi:acyltransferase domain-containing protein, partial [Streptomyces sp. NPDC049577]|uniref:type I polyketide synthase n=1 Tax=Streptomyces sp. NPDC049577 TaxID=3155153 RepID=UPI00342E01AC